MMFGILTMVHTAESKKQLDADTETLLTIGRKKLCQFSVLKFQQMDGLNTALPHRTPEDSGSPHTDFGECSSVDAIPGAGDYGRRRNLLR